MFTKIHKTVRGRDALVISGLGSYKIADTLECGQAFRYELAIIDGDYVEFMGEMDLITKPTAAKIVAATQEILKKLR